MNDAELDHLIAATAAVSDAEVARWDLADDDLCEEIMSTPAVTPTPHPTDDVPAPTTPIRLSPHRRWPVLLGGAAAVAALAAATALVVGPTEPSEANTLETALAQSTVALGRSGRATVVTQAHWNEGTVLPGDGDPRTELWEYSGDDLSVTLEVGPPGPPDTINRLVDGELYLYHQIDTEGTFQWFHDVNGDQSMDGFVDPRTMLGQLSASSTFDEVGTEPVDGVDTRHLRATDPAATASALTLPGIAREGEVTALDVWVSDDDIVRRVDVTTEADYDVVYSHSIRFYDIGAPITIEAPEAAQDVDPQG